MPYLDTLIRLALELGDESVSELTHAIETSNVRYLALEQCALSSAVVFPILRTIEPAELKEKMVSNAMKRGCHARLAASGNNLSILSGLPFC